MTQADVLSHIEKAIRGAGSARQLALDWKVSAQYLSDVRRGRRMPGPLILRAMGLEARPTYVRNGRA